MGGVVGLGPACYALKDRDGWHTGQRAEREKLVAQNRHYLLLHDYGTEPNLASKALAHCSEKKRRRKLRTEGRAVPARATSRT